MKSNFGKPLKFSRRRFRAIGRGHGRGIWDDFTSGVGRFKDSVVSGLDSIGANKLIPLIYDQFKNKKDKSKAGKLIGRIIDTGFRGKGASALQGQGIRKYKNRVK